MDIAESGVLPRPVPRVRHTTAVELTERLSHHKGLNLSPDEVERLAGAINMLADEQEAQANHSRQVSSPE